MSRTRMWFSRERSISTCFAKEFAHNKKKKKSNTSQVQCEWLLICLDRNKRATTHTTTTKNTFTSRCASKIQTKNTMLILPTEFDSIRIFPCVFFSFSLLPSITIRSLSNSLHFICFVLFSQKEKKIVNAQEIRVRVPYSFRVLLHTLIIICWSKTKCILNGPNTKKTDW